MLTTDKEHETYIFNVSHFYPEQGSLPVSIVSGVENSPSSYHI